MSWDDDASRPVGLVEHYRDGKLIETWTFPPSSDGLCGRLLIGQSDDTFDPVCRLPAGHDQPCRP